MLSILRLLQVDPKFPWVVKWLPRASAGALAVQIVLVQVLDIFGLAEHSARIRGIHEMRWIAAGGGALVLIGITDEMVQAYRRSKIAKEVKERTGMEAVVTLSRGGEAYVAKKDTSVEKDKFKAPTVAVEVVPAATNPGDAPLANAQTFTPPGE